jgi:hypothetical protein
MEILSQSPGWISSNPSRSDWLLESFEKKIHYAHKRRLDHANAMQMRV